MKRLFLLRHAKSSHHGEVRDAARPLAPGGIWAGEAIAERCAKKLSKVDLVLCSSAIRTHETLRLLERHLPPSCKIMLDDGLYLADRRTLENALRRVDDGADSVLVVGHEPGLSDLADSLCGDEGRPKARRRLAKGFKTASLVTVDLVIERWADLGWGTGSLREMIRPKDLR
jgi:phosphohistidine phosphatase